MRATVGDMREAERWGLKTRGCPSADPLMQWLIRMTAGRQCVWLGGRPGRVQDDIELVEWSRRGCLVSAPGVRLARKIWEITFVEHKEGFHFPFVLNVFFSFLCLKLNNQKPSFLSFLWLSCVELGCNTCLRLVTFSQHPHRSSGLKRSCYGVLWRETTGRGEGLAPWVTLKQTSASRGVQCWGLFCQSWKSIVEEVGKTSCKV